VDGTSEEGNGGKGGVGGHGGVVSNSRVKLPSSTQSSPKTKPLESVDLTLWEFGFGGYSQGIMHAGAAETNQRDKDDLC
jgi:hypothetical protein